MIYVVFKVKLQCWEIPKLSHLSVASRKRNGPTQGQTKTLTRVGLEPKTYGFWSPLLHRLSNNVRTGAGSGYSKSYFTALEASNPTLVRVFLCPCVGPLPFLGQCPDGITWEFSALQLFLKNYLDHANISAARSTLTRTLILQIEQCVLVHIDH